MPTDSTSLNDPRRIVGDPPALPTRETLELIRTIIQENYEQRGVWPSVTEIQRGLLRPGV